MLDRLKAIYSKNQFLPSPAAFLINPFFFTRRNLFKLILKHGHYVQGKVLDFGCGGKPYKKIFKTTDYIGLDIEVSGHPHRNEQIDIFYDGKTIPFPDKTFDSIFTSEVFEHIFNLDSILFELHRILKPGGHILITIPFVWDEHEIPYDFARYTSFGIRNLLEKNNFEILKLEKSSTFIETVFQLCTLYLSKKFSFKNNFLTLFFQLIMIAPVTLIGLILSRIFPNYETLYLNTVTIARRTK